MSKTIINTPVHVTAVGFKKNLSAYPRQMVYDGAIYDFVDAGLSCVVRKGKSLSHILTLSDGRRQFRLKSDNHGGVWTLLSVSA